MQNFLEKLKNGWSHAKEPLLTGFPFLRPLQTVDEDDHESSLVCQQCSECVGSMLRGCSGAAGLGRGWGCPKLGTASSSSPPLGTAEPLGQAGSTGEKQGPQRAKVGEREGGATTQGPWGGLEEKEGWRGCRLSRDPPLQPGDIPCRSWGCAESGRSCCPWSCSLGKGPCQGRETLSQGWSTAEGKWWKAWIEGLSQMPIVWLHQNWLASAARQCHNRSWHCSCWRGNPGRISCKFSFLQSGCTHGRLGSGC